MTEYYIKPRIVVAALDAGQLAEFPIGRKILVVASGSVYRGFGLEEMITELRLSRMVRVFDHIRPDVPFSDLDRVLRETGPNRPDSIIAIGGGSVIDAAKTLSVAFEGVDYKHLFYKRKPMPEKKVPVIAVPTTAGTGAELSFGAIIFDDQNGVKGGLRGEIVQPDGVLIDSRLHNACPSKLKAEVGFDCLTHAVETYISRQHNKLVRYHSVACIRDVLRYLVPACESNDPKAMEQLAISAALMGINLAYSSTCLPHRIQYVIGPRTHTSHAQGLIALYRGWLPHLIESRNPDLEELCADLGLSVGEFTGRLNDLRSRLGIDYSLADLGVRESEIAEIAAGVSGNVVADPSYTDSGSIKRILKLAI